MNKEDEFRIIGRIAENTILYTNNLGNEETMDINSFAKIMDVVKKPKFSIHKDYQRKIFKNEDFIKLEKKVKKYSKKLKKAKENLAKLKMGERGFDIDEDTWNKLKKEIRAFRNGKQVIFESGQSYVEDGKSYSNWYPVKKEKDFNMFYKFMIVQKTTKGDSNA